MDKTPLIACHDCDALYQTGPVPVGGEARCVRCGALLYREKKDSLDRALALTFASLILLASANIFPFLSLSLGGQSQSCTFIGGVRELFRQGMWEVALLVLLTAVAAPLLYLLGMIYILLPLRLGVVPPRLARASRLVRLIQPWSMAEVFMIGILVSIVKLAKLADIDAGLSLYSFAGLIVVMAWTAYSMDFRRIRERLEINED
jgi:paraquat-inducible protein A